jgi:hypothetical protein
MKMIVEKQMECTMAGETEVLGENLASQILYIMEKPRRKFHNTLWVFSIILIIQAGK